MAITSSKKQTLLLSEVRGCHTLIKSATFPKNARQAAKPETKTPKPAKYKTKNEKLGKDGKMKQKQQNWFNFLTKFEKFSGRKVPETRQNA